MGQRRNRGFGQPGIPAGLHRAGVEVVERVEEDSHYYRVRCLVDRSHLFRVGARRLSPAGEGKSRTSHVVCPLCKPVKGSTTQLSARERRAAGAA